MALKAGFLIGGDTNETPQSLARKRALIAQIMANGRAPTNIGEGLNALGDGIVANVLERRASAAEKAGRASADAALPWAQILGGGFGGSPATASTQTPAAATTGQPPVPGLQSQGSDMSAYRDAIASIESAGSGDYAAVGPTHPKLGRALGRYQVMEANIGPWSQEVLGRTVTPDEFMANPQLQDQIFDGKFQSYVSKFGPEGAAQAWFGGPGGVGKTDRKDSLGTSIGAYGQKFTNALGRPSNAAEAVTAMGQGGQMPEPQAAAYVDPMVVNPNSRPQAMAPQQGPARNGLPFDLVSGSPQLARADTRQGILRALTGQTGPEPGATGAFPAAPVSAPMAAPQAAPAPSMAAPAPMQAAPAAAPAPQPMAQPQISTQQLIAAINNPWLSDSQRAIAQSMLEQQMQANDPMRQIELQKAQLELAQMQNPQPGFRTLTDDEEKAMGLDPSGLYQQGADGKLVSVQEPAKAPEQPSNVREYEYAAKQARDAGVPADQIPTYDEWSLNQKRAGAQNINVGGGSDKQVFDAMTASADSARAAVTGLNSLREAKAAVEGGIITGAGADARLGLQKIGALLGVADPSVIENTETFRAAIAPQVAAVMKATVGSTQISNADREFAQQAAGGSITLDERSIRRLLDIMERAGTASVQSHMDRLNKVYPEGGQFERERALFGVTLPEMAVPTAPQPSAEEIPLDDLLKQYGD